MYYATIMHKLVTPVETENTNTSLFTIPKGEDQQRNGPMC